MCKGPGAGKHLVCSRNSTEISVTGKRWGSCEHQIEYKICKQVILWDERGGLFPVTVILPRYFQRVREDKRKYLW